MPKREISLPDTNSILRYLLADNKDLHEKACGLFEKVRTGEAAVLLLESVLVECVYVLTKFYGVPRQEVAGTLKGFIRYRGVTNNDKKELAEALTLYGDTTFDIVDCILCVKAKNYGLTLFTFDKALARKAGKV
jgi:predicted nucleic-acid-binding protein